MKKDKTHNWCFYDEVWWDWKVYYTQLLKCSECNIIKYKRTNETNDYIINGSWLSALHENNLPVSCTELIAKNILE